MPFMPTFSRSERLKRRRLLSRMFKEGRSYMAYPVRVMWLPQPEPVPGETLELIQVAFSVPKRTFKTAVSRNKLKRRMREAYRLHKEDFFSKLTAAQQPPIALMLLYVAKEALPYAEIESGIRKMIRKWSAD